MLLYIHTSASPRSRSSARQRRADGKCGKQQRRSPDKQPLECVKRRAKHRSLRISVIPPEIRTAECDKRGKARRRQHTEHDKQNVQCPSALSTSARELQIDDFELFRYRPQLIRLRRSDGLAEQYADRRIKHLAYRDKHIRIGDRQPRFP